MAERPRITDAPTSLTVFIVMRGLPSETGGVAEVYLRPLPCATLRAPGPRASWTARLRPSASTTTERISRRAEAPGQRAARIGKPFSVEG
jgi:hypothetical protein